MRRILIVGGQYAGFYTAWKLEKRLRADEAEITVIDPRGYMPAAQAERRPASQHSYEPSL
ncbi:hypothetical protein ACO2Q7_11975 [Rathayibacter sp. KR2-224]|uniref:hypothetical protein n=1 Tax=Rathayibacter sp. KR2-224 TaxID=3400913 RepID=UPI003C0409E7